MINRRRRGALLPTLLIVVAIVVLAWLAFAISYLSARHIPAPHWNNIGMGWQQRSESTPQNLTTQPERRYTRREAIRMR